MINWYWWCDRKTDDCIAIAKQYMLPHGVVVSNKESTHLFEVYHADNYKESLKQLPPHNDHIRFCILQDMGGFEATTLDRVIYLDSNLKYQKPKLTTVDVFLGSTCNSTCPYCPFWEDGVSPTEKQVKYAMFEILHAVEGKTCITFTGGEPTLWLNHIVYMYNTLKKHELFKSASICTNGTNNIELVKASKWKRTVFNFHTVYDVYDGCVMLMDGTKLTFNELANDYRTMYTLSPKSSFGIVVTPTNMRYCKELATVFYQQGIDNVLFNRASDRAGKYLITYNQLATIYGERHDLFFKRVAKDFRQLCFRVSYDVLNSRWYSCQNRYFDGDADTDDWVSNIVNTDLYYYKHTGGV